MYVRSPMPHYSYQDNYMMYGSPYVHGQMSNYYTAHNPTPFDVFQKPAQPMNWNPYQQSDPGAYPPPKGNNLLYYFQDSQGQLDIDKMLTTAGQVANTVHQISPVVKQVGSIMKQIKL